MLSIHTNYSSANATKHVKHAHLNINSSIEKLSTGKRINAGKDDPGQIGVLETRGFQDRFGLCGLGHRFVDGSLGVAGQRGGQLILAGPDPGGASGVGRRVLIGREAVNRAVGLVVEAVVGSHVRFLCV